MSLYFEVHWNELNEHEWSFLAAHDTYWESYNRLLDELHMQQTMADLLLSNTDEHALTMREIHRQFDAFAERAYNRFREAVQRCAVTQDEANAEAAIGAAPIKQLIMMYKNDGYVIPEEAAATHVTLLVG